MSSSDYDNSNTAATTQARQQEQGGVVRRINITMDECLFGQSRMCPPDIWDAVLGDCSNTHNSTSRLNNDNNSNNDYTSSSIRHMKIDDEFLASHNHQWDDEGGNSNTNNLIRGHHLHTIQLQELRRLASQGMEDQNDDFRAVAWRVLLGVLPLDTSMWKETLIDKRSMYRGLVSDVFVMEPGDKNDGNELRGGNKRRNNRRNNNNNRYRGHPKNNNKKAAVASQQQANQDYTHDDNDLSNSTRANNDNKSTTTSLNKEEEEATTNTATTEDEKIQKQQEEIKLNSLEKQQTLSENPKEEEELKTVEEDNTTTDTNDTTTIKTEQRQEGEEDTTLTEKPSLVQEKSISNSSNTSLLADVVPIRIREEWKKSGHDFDFCFREDQDMNALLLTKPKKKNSDDEDDTKWSQLFENATLLDEIRKDVVRTHPDLYFFLEPENNLGKRRYAAIERILFVWARLNKGVRYVQGMNEIVGTIYYVLANDENGEWACEAEADTYFLFNTLMSEMRDIFVPDLDEADTGIQGRISNMTALLSLHDPEVRCHLVDIGIDPAYFAIRWLTTLLSREFLLPDTIRLWDSMFASTHKDNFMRYVCATMIMIIRNELLKGDFTTCLRLLQSYPTTNIEGLLEASRSLWIYESQVTLACHKGGISLHQALCTITPPPSIVMAYGLPGGVAHKAHQKGDSSGSTNSRSSRAASRNRDGGGFFSRANAVLGQISTRGRYGFR